MALLMHDGFEQENWLENWDWISSEQVAYRVTEKSYEGDYSLFFDPGGQIRKYFDPPLTNGYISYFFYDEAYGQMAPDENDIIVFAGDILDPTRAFRIGVATQASSTNYCYWTTGINWTITPIKRTVGWHQIEIWVYNGGLTAAMDGQTVVSGYTAVDVLRGIHYMTSPGALVWWIDDFNVHSPPPYYPGDGNGGPGILPNIRVFVPLLIGLGGLLLG